MELRLRCGPAFRDSTLLSLSLSISGLRQAPAAAAAAAAAVTVSAAFNNRSRVRARRHRSRMRRPSSRREIRRTSTHSAADSAAAATAAADSLCGARVLLRSDIALNKFSAILCAAYAGRPASAPVSVLGFHKEQTSRYSRA